MASPSEDGGRSELRRLAGKLRQRAGAMQKDLEAEVQRIGERRKAIEDQLAPLFAGGVD